MTGVTTPKYAKGALVARVRAATMEGGSPAMAGANRESSRETLKHEIN